jgi:glycosyltransferase involved in cell wall biosynthesis
MIGKRAERKKVLLCVQAFPPLLKAAGGVAKRYLTVTRALIEDLGYDVTIVTPVNVYESKEPEVEGWLEDGSLTFIPARGVRVTSSDGPAVFFDIFSCVNTYRLFQEMFTHKYSLCIADDIPWRMQLLFLCRAAHIPLVTTTHTDYTHMQDYKNGGIAGAMMKSAWNFHVLSGHYSDVHATVSRVFADDLSKKENIKINAIWPPILWANEFKKPKDKRIVSQSINFFLRCPLFADYLPIMLIKIGEAKEKYAEWVKELGFKPRMIMMYVGRWSKEKRIHLLFNAVPEGCALVICGDGNNDYADLIARTSLKHVLPCRKMLDGHELRVVYTACDLFVSASDFETLGNTVVEALCTGTPCAVHPEQGHLEHVVDGKNSLLVDYNDSMEAKRMLNTFANYLDSGKPVADFFPELDSKSLALRTGKFAENFDKEVISVATSVMEERLDHSPLVKTIFQYFYILASAVTWCIMRPIMRATYTCLSYPKFEILPGLGGAVEMINEAKKIDA